MSSGIRLTALAARRETFRHLFLGSLTQFVLEPRSLAWECASASDGPGVVLPAIEATLGLAIYF